MPWSTPHFLKSLTSVLCYSSGVINVLESIKCSLYCIDTVSGSKGLGKDVLDSCSITNETNCTTCDDTCTRNSWLQKYGSTLEVSNNVVRDCSSLERYCDD